MSNVRLLGLGAGQRLRRLGDFHELYDIQRGERVRGIAVQVLVPTHRREMVRRFSFCEAPTQYARERLGAGAR